jgi:hypothetical protein
LTAKAGVEVAYTEQLDKTTVGTNSGWSLDAGQGLSGLPDSILQMTGKPRDQIDPTMLPVTISIFSPTNFSSQHTPIAQI